MKVCRDCWRLPSNMMHRKKKWRSDGVDGIATRYVLEILKFEPRWGQEIFSSPHPSKLALGLTQSPVKEVTGLFPGVKCPGRGVDHPPLLVPTLKNEDSYTSTHSVPVVVLWGENLHLLQYDLYVPIISLFVSTSFHCLESTLLSVSFLMTAALFCDFSNSLAFKLLIYASS